MKWGKSRQHTKTNTHTGIKVTKYVNLFHTRKQNHAKKPINRNDGHAELYADISRPSAGPIVREKEYYKEARRKGISYVH
jgi:hypothetical protein